VLRNFVDAPFPPNSTGFAVAHTRQRAVRSALFEVVERDTILRCWPRRSLWRVPAIGEAEEMLLRCGEAGVQVDLMLCRSRTPLHVALAFAYRQDSKPPHDECRGAIGLGSQFVLEKALAHSIGEACQMLCRREQSRSLVVRPRYFDTLPWSSRSSEGRCGSDSWSRLIREYRPSYVDLTTRTLKSMDLHLVRVLSPRAVTSALLRPAFPRRRWHGPLCTERLRRELLYYFDEVESAAGLTDSGGDT
jgi:hypothetical protein